MPEPTKVYVNGAPVTPGKKVKGDIALKKGVEELVKAAPKLQDAKK